MALPSRRTKRRTGSDPVRRFRRDEADRFADRQARLFAILRCPRCQGSLRLDSPTEVAGAVLAGDLVCADHARVGVVSRFRPSFLDRELDAIAPGTTPTTVASSVDLAALTASQAGWSDSEAGHLAIGTDGETLVVPADGPVRLRFYGNEWSGVVGIEAPGVSADHDLYRASFEPVDIDVPVASSGTLTITATGRHHAASLGAQVRIGAIDIAAPVADAPVPSLDAANRGNPYPPRFHELVGQQRFDAVILDCGGGDRRYGDDRVFNLEYLSFDRPDLFGDGLALPLADTSVDLIMSQAVLEHVPDPQVAVDEMTRILKPGGTLYLEVAFLQPVHAVPHHYLNVTPPGLAHLCRDLEIVTVSTQGGLYDLVDWVGRLTDAPTKLGADRFAATLDALRDLDHACNPVERDQFGFASVVEARKR